MDMLKDGCLTKKAPNGELQKENHSQASVPRNLVMWQQSGEPGKASIVKFVLKRPQAEESDPGPSKIMRVDNARLPEPRDLSTFPVEILLMIFDYLKAGDKCIKPLIATCKTFRDILAPRLSLRLDFDKIYEMKCYPDIQRSYSEIMFSGTEVDSDIIEIRRVLKSSGNFVTKLSFISRTNARCRVKTETFLAILKLHSGVKELVVSKVQVVGTQFKFDKRKIEKGHYPQLSHLRKLTLNKVGGPINEVLKNLKGLEELVVPNDINGLSRDNQKQLGVLALAQKSLKKLETKTYLGFIASHRSLETLIFGHMLILPPDNLFKHCSKLREVKVTTSVQDNRCSSSLFTSSSSATIEAIEIEGYISSSFIIQSILPNYPSLKVFKSKNVNWTKA